MFGIRAGRAFDGERVVPGGALVLVDGGRIAGVEPGAAPAPEGCQVLEAPGGTVLPGLVDAHVHLCADDTDETLDRIGEPSTDAMMAVIEQSLRRHLAGVTTVRDLGDRRFAVLDWRSSARSRGAVYPAVVAAGPPITSVGGHCANMGGEAAGENQLRTAVRERAGRGVDVIKIMTSGGFATTGTQVMLCQFSLGEVRAVVEEAHAAGLPATAHAHGLPAVHMAMAAGVDGIEHCSFLTDKGVSQSEEDLARLAATGPAVCPTLGFAGIPEAPPNAAAVLAKLGMSLEQVLEVRKLRVAQMHAAGVRIVSGSDGGIAAVRAARPAARIGGLPGRRRREHRRRAGVRDRAGRGRMRPRGQEGPAAGRVRCRPARRRRRPGRRDHRPGPAGGGVRRRAAPGRSRLTCRPGRPLTAGAAVRHGGGANSIRRKILDFRSFRAG
jgi:imidazolonepropionase-like amidohydrolase